MDNIVQKLNMYSGSFLIAVCTSYFCAGPASDVNDLDETGAFPRYIAR